MQANHRQHAARSQQRRRFRQRVTVWQVVEHGDHRDDVVRLVGVPRHEISVDEADSLVATRHLPRPLNDRLVFIERVDVARARRKLARERAEPAPNIERAPTTMWNDVDQRVVIVVVVIPAISVHRLCTRCGIVGPEQNLTPFFEPR